MSSRTISIILTLLLLGSLIVNALLYQMLAAQSESLTMLYQHTVDLETALANKKISTQEDPGGAITAPQQTSGNNIEVNSKHVSLGNLSMTVTHFCDGRVEPILAEGVEPVEYCLGVNRLVFTDSSGREKELSRLVTEKSAEAPVLKDAYVIPSNAEERMMLISYAPDDCAAPETCGAGIPELYVTHAVNIASLSVRDLDGAPHSYPYKWAWNGAGTKALVIPNTCGGAGCVQAELIGYDLAKDASKPVTKETAAGGLAEFFSGEQQEQYQDISGNALQFWKKISWNNDNTFRATIITAPFGNPLDITGNFK